MKTSAPKQLTLIVSVILAVIGILPLFGIHITGVGNLTAYALPAAYVVLLAGVLFDGV